MASTFTILLSKAEKSYIQAGIVSNTPSRADGRSLYAFRTVALQKGVAPMANGSARLSIGRNAHDGSGGTDILAATKLEVESVEPGNEGVDGGRIVCTVTCTPSAYSSLTSSHLDDLQTEYTVVLSSILSHPSLHPSNLTIIPRLKSWVLHLDLVILSDGGNVFDALFLAARAALCDTKVPRTRSVEYRATILESKMGSGAVMGGALKRGDIMDVDIDADVEVQSSFDSRQLQQLSTDFELSDYWDEGEVLEGKNRWPLCITLNTIPPSYHFIDATPPEEASTPLRLLLIFSFPDSSSDSTSPIIQGIRTLGAGEVTPTQINDLITQGEKYARELWTALDGELKKNDETLGQSYDHSNPSKGKARRL